MRKTVIMNPNVLCILKFYIKKKLMTATANYHVRLVITTLKKKNVCP